MIEIDIEGTGISIEARDAILHQCQALRAEQASQKIPLRLKSWGLKSKAKFDFSQVLKFGENEKKDINEWLVRLENTKDFNSQFQTTLAKAVCAMLVDAARNKSFRASFFAQIADNLEGCQDRAAMALNEIFTAWELSKLDDSAPLKDGLQILARGAKTLALRAAIAQRIGQHQEENGAIESEAVEIYLYYETVLKNKLNLLSIIENMAYGEIGQREWIQEDELVQEVNTKYLNHLIEFDSFQEIIKKDSAYQKAAKQLESFEGRRIKLEEAEPKGVDEFSNEYLNWKSEVGRLGAERKLAEANLRKRWVQEQW